MSYTRKVADFPKTRGEANLAAINEIITSLAAAGIIVHHQYKSAQLVSTADASSLATSKTLAKALALAIQSHAVDTDVHTAADVSSAATQAAAWASAPAEPADLTEVQNVANELKTDINAHVAAAAAHRSKWGSAGVDGVITENAITTATATDQDTANALLNAIKAFYNLHIQSAASTLQIVLT
jgi:hypothetical protein